MTPLKWIKSDLISNDALPYFFGSIWCVNLGIKVLTQHKMLLPADYVFGSLAVLFSAWFFASGIYNVCRRFRVEPTA